MSNGIAAPPHLFNGDGTPIVEEGLDYTYCLGHWDFRQYDPVLLRVPDLSGNGNYAQATADTYTVVADGLQSNVARSFFNLLDKTVRPPHVFAASKMIWNGTPAAHNGWNVLCGHDQGYATSSYIFTTTGYGLSVDGYDVADRATVDFNFGSQVVTNMGNGGAASQTVNRWSVLNIAYNAGDPATPLGQFCRFDINGGFSGILGEIVYFSQHITGAQLAQWNAHLSARYSPLFP